MVIWLSISRIQNTATCAPRRALPQFYHFRSICWNGSSPKPNKINLVIFNPKTKYYIKFHISKCYLLGKFARYLENLLGGNGLIKGKRSSDKVTNNHSFIIQLKLVFCKCLLGISKALTCRGQEPPSIPAWIATPVTTARSGSTDVLGSFPKNS